MITQEIVACYEITMELKQEGKGQVTTFEKNDIDQGYNINQLESNGSKTSDKSTSTKHSSSISNLNDIPRAP